MKKIILFIILFAGCEKVSIHPTTDGLTSIKVNKMAVIVSKSSPIAFYDYTDDDGFNEVTQYGINNDYYYNPLAGVEAIKFQYFKSGGGTLTIKIYDACDGTLVGTMTKTLIVTNYYDASIYLSEIDRITTNLIYISIKLDGLELLRSETLQLKDLIDSSDFDNYDFATDLSGWTEYANPNGGTTSYTWENGAAMRLKSTPIAESVILGQPFSVGKGDIIVIEYGTSIDNTPASDTILFHGKRALDGVWEIIATYTDVFTTSYPTVDDLSFSLKAETNYTAIGLSTTLPFTSPFTAKHYISYFSITLSRACPELVVINYRNNNTNFDSMVYDETAANSYDFSCPAQFHKQRWEKEQETIEKSDGTYVRTFNQMVLKRRLEIGYVPNYVHDKLNRILMHDNVTINGVEYIAKDEYEHENINRYNLSKASVWLTEKDNIIKNVL